MEAIFLKVPTKRPRGKDPLWFHIPRCWFEAEKYLPKWKRRDLPTHVNHQIGSEVSGVLSFHCRGNFPKHSQISNGTIPTQKKKMVLNLPPPNKKMTFKKSNPTPLTVFQGKTWKNLPPPSHLALQKSQSPFEVALGASADRSLGSVNLGINPPSYVIRGTEELISKWHKLLGKLRTPSHHFESFLESVLPNDTNLGWFNSFYSWFLTFSGVKWPSDHKWPPFFGWSKRSLAPSFSKISFGPAEKKTPSWKSRRLRG